MKKMNGKRVILVMTAVAVITSAALTVGSGFSREPDGYIRDFSVSEDGGEMTLTMEVGRSMGYIRKVRVCQQQGCRLYLECLSAFGGINGSIGAKGSFAVPLEEDTPVIALYRGKNAYKEIFRKDEFGRWERAE